MAELIPPSVLLYTMAFDSPGSLVRRVMAKLLVSSLLRSYFNGRIVVFRNTEAPLFKVAKAGVEEVYVATTGQGTEFSTQFPHLAADYLDTNGCSVVAYLDAASAVRRNIDHLFPVDRPWDLLWFFGGRAWAVKTEFYQELMLTWRRMEEADIALPENGGDPCQISSSHPNSLRRIPFERDEIQSVDAGTSYLDWREAAILSVADWVPNAQLEFLTGLFYARYFGDQTGHFLDILEP